MPPHPIIVIGAGPAGLAAARQIQQAGLPVTLLERGSGPGESWRNLYDSLRLHTGKHLSGLPGLSFPRSAPLFPSRADFLKYLEDYSRHLKLPVVTQCEVKRAKWNGEAWILETSQKEWRAQGLVLATGLMSNPARPAWPGSENYRGEIVHSIEYRNPDRWLGKRVLVVGVGNSGAEIASELSEAGVDVTISVRSGAHVMPLVLFGLPIQYWAAILERFPRGMREALARMTGALNRFRKGPPALPVPPWSALDRPPVIGFKLPEAIRAGKATVQGEIGRFGPREIIFKDGAEERFEAVILATGFRASVGFIEERFETDERGFPRTEGVRCVDLPRCWVVGHRYAAVGALANIRRDAKKLAQEIAAQCAFP